MRVRPWTVRFLLGAAVATLLFAVGCAHLPAAFGPSAPPPVLHPQVSRVRGAATVRPRHAREARPLTAPSLLEPDDRIATGPGGGVELLLPEGGLRLYADTEVEVRFSFEGRTPVCREVRVNRGEVAVWHRGGGAFEVRTDALEVAPGPDAVFLVALRGDTHVVVDYRGAVEARNVKIRGQTVIRLDKGQRLTLAENATRAHLEVVRLPDGWARWDDAADAGVLPPPAPAPAPKPAR